MLLPIRALIFVWSGQTLMNGEPLKLYRMISLSSLQPISRPLLKRTSLTTQHKAHASERISIDMQLPFCIQGCWGSKASLDMKTQLLYSSVNLMAFHWTDKRPLNHSSAREMLYAHSFPVAHRSEINGVHRDRARGRPEGSGIAKLCIMHVCAMHAAGACEPI